MSSPYGFDTSTLESVGTPFQGHTDLVTGLVLFFDDALLVSAPKTTPLSSGLLAYLWAETARSRTTIQRTQPSSSSTLNFTSYGFLMFFLL
jgi:hypothetical protein